MSRSRAFFGLGFWALTVATAYGQPPLPPSADVDAIFARYDQGSTPGCALGVYLNGQMAYERGYGMADLGHGVPISPTTVFYIGSTAKQFTAFAVAMLAERGSLSLTDSVRKYIPELPEWGESISIEHLIHHTSGLRDYLGLWSMSGRSFADEIPLEHAIDLIAQQRGLNFVPGSEWSYSNSGYVLLAEIVGRVTGSSLRQFMDDEAFAPLGMESTLFYDDNAEIVVNRANGYQPDGDGGYRLFRTSYALVGDGGLLTTVADLLKWDENFYQIEPVGGRPLVDTLTTPGHLDNGEPVSYAFGLMPGTHRGLPIVQHGGGFIGYSAQLLRFPTEHFSVAVLCNDASANAEGLALQVAALYLADRLDPLPGPSAPSEAGTPADVNREDLELFLGRYAPQPGLIIDVVMLGDALALQPLGGPALTLTATSNTTFSTPALPDAVRFSINAQGEPSMLIEGIGQSQPAPRLPPMAALSDDDLAEYAGRYTSAELDTWFQVRATGALELRRRYQAWEQLQQIAPDRFVSPSGELRFDRAEGRIAGFQIGAARVRGVVFMKEGLEASGL